MKKMQQGFLIKKGNKFYIDSKKTPSILLNQLHVDLMIHYKKHIKGKLLDVGCGERPYRLIYDELVSESIGCDVESCVHDQTSIDVFATADNLPFESESFDTVICTNVLEHVSEAFKGFHEIGRVLTSGGHLICSTPYLYPTHEAPYDFYRYTIYGLRHQLETNGMKVIAIVPHGGAGMMLMVYMNLFITRLIKSDFLTEINCTVQKTIYPLYKRAVFQKINSGVNSITSILSCGYFVVAEKQK